MVISAIIQARLNSTRLPNKTFAEIEGYPLIWHIINRIKKSMRINDIVVATTINKEDDLLGEWCGKNNIKSFRGSENNVLERYYFAALESHTDIIVRVTADDPFKDPEITDEVIDFMIEEKLEFAYNNNPPSYPEGLDTEVFTMEALKKAYETSTDAFEHEHVTQYFYKNPLLIKQGNCSYHSDLSHLRWTIDKVQDLEMARTVYKYLFNDKEVFLFRDILQLLEVNSWISEINSGVERSDMYRKGMSNEKN
ncbi:MAG: glycosyltransferase family protein [Firmicutes bacterium]|nr:glycosyltransferase family protein [Bacillota bacterium]